MIVDRYDWKVLIAIAIGFLTLFYLSTTWVQPDEGETEDVQPSEEIAVAPTPQKKALLQVVIQRGGEIRRVEIETNRGNISLSGGLDVPTAYYFRGILQEDEDFIAQPYVDATFSLHKNDKGFNSLSASLGMWNSLLRLRS
jgi:hypothetical protein